MPQHQLRNVIGAQLNETCADAPIQVELKKAPQTTKACMILRFNLSARFCSFSINSTSRAKRAAFPASKLLNSSQMKG
jgi:hypothetical protein